MDILPSNPPRNKPHYAYTLAYPEIMGGHVFYVGKGQGSRIHEHERRLKSRDHQNSYKNAVISKILNAGHEIVKTKVAFFAIESESLELEMALIFLMRPYGYLTNLSDGGEGTHWNTLSDEARKKVAESSRGRLHSEETRKKMSEAAKKRGFTQEHRRKITESLKGKKASEETRRKMSTSNKESHQSEEYRQKQRDILREKMQTEEYRQKQRENAKRQWASEEMRKSMMEARHLANERKNNEI